MSRSILIVHTLFDVLGGSEFLALNTARALSQSGYSVDILTFTPVNNDMLKKLFNFTFTIRIENRRILMNDLLYKITGGRAVRLRRLIFYSKLLSELEEYKDSYDVVIETQSNLPASVDISYIHFPTKPESSSGLKRLYEILISHYIKKIEKRGRPGLVLTNSKWTAAQVYKAYGIIPHVVYPPVDVEYFSRAAEGAHDENVVVTVSRFTPVKGIEKICLVGKSLNNYVFIIAGSTSKYSYKTIDAIKSKCNELAVDNVVLKPNLPRNQLLDFMSRAKYYLHPPYSEHFGIAVVEAMAAGLIPIVYQDGGAWHDIVKQVSPILGYKDILDVPRIIELFDKHPDIAEEVRKRALNRSKYFTFRRFREEMRRIVDYVYEIKNFGKSS